MERELKMWRFILGVIVGIALTSIVIGGLPYKWNTDPDRQTLNQAHDKLVVIIGVDENLDFISQYRVNEYNKEQRIIQIYRNKEDADKAKKSLVDVWSKNAQGEKK